MIDTDKYEGHTEGPWRSYPMEDGGEEWYEIKCKSEPLGFISVHHENHVNSLLVADAPLLLEEVKRLRKALAYTASLLTCRIEGDDIPIVGIREYALGVVGMTADEAMTTTNLMEDEKVIE